MDQPEEQVQDGVDSASGEIYKAIPKIMEELESVGKNKKTDASLGGYAFRSIDDVYFACQKVMAKNKVFTTSTPIERVDTERKTSTGKLMYHSRIKIRFKFSASDGSHVYHIMDGEGMDTGDKTSNKCYAIAHKYALCQVFVIPTKDIDDPDKTRPEVESPPKSSHQPPKVSEAQIKRLYTIATGRKWTHDDVKQYIITKYKLTTSKDLTLKQYDEIVNDVQIYQPTEALNLVPQT